MSGTRRRYPGAVSFGSDEGDLFFGRVREIEQLRALVLAERLTVVYARSGIGKTSLINAGLKKWLWTERLAPVPVRFNLGHIGTVEALYESVDRVSELPGIEVVAGDETSLWRFFTTLQIWRGNVLLTPILILDQFEELFTLQPATERARFIEQLADIVRGPTGSGRSAGQGAPQRPLDVKALLSIREDFLGELEELSDAIPQILQSRFRLGPLLEADAREAITRPAALESAEMRTKPFAYHPEALNGILRSLCDQPRSSTARPQAEPFHLQVVCTRVEDIVERIRKDAPDKRVLVTWDMIGREPGLTQALESFYEQRLSELYPEFPDIEPVRRLCEDGLISATNRRLSLERDEIKRIFGVPPSALDRLVDLRVLRKDARVGSQYYELTHDALAKAIVETRDRRLGLVREYHQSATRLSRRLAWTLAAAFVALLALWVAFWPGLPQPYGAQAALLVARGPDRAQPIRKTSRIVVQPKDFERIDHAVERTEKVVQKAEALEAERKAGSAKEAVEPPRHGPAQSTPSVASGKSRISRVPSSRDARKQLNWWKALQNSTGSVDRLVQSARSWPLAGACAITASVLAIAAIAFAIAQARRKVASALSLLDRNLYRDALSRRSEKDSLAGLAPSAAERLAPVLGTAAAGIVDPLGRRMFGNHPAVWPRSAFATLALLASLFAYLGTRTTLPDPVNYILLFIQWTLALDVCCTAVLYVVGPPIDLEQHGGDGR